MSAGRLGVLARVAAAVAGAPAAVLYGGATAARRALYDRRLLAVHRLPVPVVSVGGLALGGEGKTPVTRLVAASLLDEGLRVGVVASGYGGRARRVCCLVPLRRWWEAGDAALELGDEPVLLASWLAGRRCLVGRGPDKLATARLLVEAGAEAIVIDDGLQHRRLARDLEILVGASRPPLPLPAGDGRELGLGVQADLRWHHGRGGSPPPRRRGDWVRSINVVCRLADGRGRTVGQGPDLAGARVFVVAGVARPSSLVELARRSGAEVVGLRARRDHRRLRPRDLEAAGRSGADLVLCSEKDAARMAGVGRWWRAAGGRPVAALVCDLEVLSGGDLLARRLARLLAGAGEAE